MADMIFTSSVGFTGLLSDNTAMLSLHYDLINPSGANLHD